MTFEEALAQQPGWVQVWVLWLVGVTIGSFVIFLFSKATRRDSLVLLIANIPNAFFMPWLYEQLGYVRLLGLSHMIF